VVVKFEGNIFKKTLHILGMTYISRLAYPNDYRAQEFISTLFQNLTGNTQLWVGLDAR
jgi:hypothetical protein